jgi:hypothetical protein
VAPDCDQYLSERLELLGVRDIEVESGGPAILPIVLEVAIEVATAEDNDSIGPTNCPELNMPD